MKCTNCGPSSTSIADMEQDVQSPNWEVRCNARRLPEFHVAGRFGREVLGSKSTPTSDQQDCEYPWPLCCSSVLRIARESHLGALCRSRGAIWWKTGVDGFDNDQMRLLGTSTLDVLLTTPPPDKRWVGLSGHKGAPMPSYVLFTSLGSPQTNAILVR